MKIKILVNQENPALIKIANLIQKSFSEYNISAIVDKKSFADYIQAINKKDFDILIGGFLPKQKLNYEKLFGSENILAYQNDLLINDLNLINQSSDWNVFSNQIKKLNHYIKTSSKIVLMSVKIITRHLLFSRLCRQNQKTRSLIFSNKIKLMKFFSRSTSDNLVVACDNE